MRILQKSAFLFTVFSVMFFATAAFAFAINDVSITSTVNFDLNTADTAAATVITGATGGLVTNIYVDTNYIDITIDNLSAITFDTTVPGNFLKITKQSGLDADYTLAPTCPTTTATITGTGAQVVLRLQVYTTDQCVAPPIPPSGGGGSAGGYRPDSNIDLPGDYTPPSMHETPTSPFTDIAGHWAEFVINTVYQQGYIQGYPDNTFRPNQYIIRAEASKLVALWLNKNITDDMCTEDFYIDVSCGEWYGKYISYLSSKGILEGYDGGIFGPARNVSRAEALKIMLYAKGLQDTDISDVINPFSDINPDDWYYKVVLIGYKLGIVEGYEDGTYKPNNPITRAEYTKIFYEVFLK